MKKTIRFGIVGCGRISKKHFDAIREFSSQATLSAICDLKQGRMDETIQSLEEFGLKPETFLNYPDLLKSGKVDVVTLATPSGHHPSQAIEAAKAGLHVVTEKPMATRWIDGKQMVEAFDRSGTSLFVVKQNRFNPTIRRVRAAIEKGRFGRLYMVSCNVFWSRPQEYYDSESWRGTWELDGGAIMNQASHYVDLLDWLIGPVDSVHAFSATLARNIQVEDTATVSLKWRSGALGSLNVTMLTYPKNLEGSITIIGEKGTVKIGGQAINKIEHWEFADQLPEDEDFQNDNYEPASVYGNGHVPYYQNVLNCLLNGGKAETDGREGLKSLELLIAIYQSARDARRVALPLDLR